MQFLIYFVALLHTSLAKDLYNIYSVEWESYKAEFGKSYSSMALDKLHMNEFLNSKKIITEHNIKFHSGKSTYEMGLNEHSDLTKTEFKRFKLGLSISDNNVGKWYYLFAPKGDEEIPSEVDWRTNGAVTPVGNQKRCGACWAFAATAALEAQHFLKTGKLVSLSQQMLVDCVDKGCSGGQPEDAFEYIKKNGGIDTEDSYPYLGVGMDCIFNNNTVGATDRGYVTISQNEEDMKKAVAIVGPVTVAITASESFMYYKSGIFQSHDCDHPIDHSVAIVGYGTTTDGIDYWILKNSWGTWWGEDGYMRIVRGKNMCRITRMSSYPLV